MKVEVKKVDSVKRQLTVTASPEVVQAKYSEVFKKIAKDAKAPGFRPGHLPQDVLEKYYSADADSMVMKELVPELYGLAVKQEKLDVVGNPSVSDIDLNRQGLTFRAQVEVGPQIELKKYKGINIPYQPVAVDADEVKRKIDSLKESRKAESLDDAFAKSLGYCTLQELQKAIEMQLYLEKQNAQHQGIERAVIDAVTKDLHFSLPDSLVARRLGELERQWKLELLLHGMPQEEIEKQHASIIERLQPEAKAQVKVFLVLAEIAKKENIPDDKDLPRRVVEFLFREAEWTAQETGTGK